MKKIFNLLLCSSLILSLTGCGSKIKESDIIGTKWSVIEETRSANDNGIYKYLKFKKGNVANFCDEDEKYCLNYTWEIKDGYIELYYSSDKPVQKYELSDDKTIIIDIIDDHKCKKVE